MLDAMSVPVWIAGADGARTMFHRAWTTFTGRTEAEELGWGWTEGA